MVVFFFLSLISFYAHHPSPYFQSKRSCLVLSSFRLSLLPPGGARQGIIGAAAWGTASVMAQLAWDRFDAWRILERQRIESGHSSSGSEKKGSSHRQEAALSSESASFSVEDGGSSSPLPKGGPFDREQGRGKQEIQPKGAKLPSSTPPQWAAERPSRASVNGRPQNTLAQPVRGDDLASLSNAVATASADAASRVESTSAPAAAVAENASPRWFPIHRTNPDEQRLKKLRQRLANVEEALGLQGGRQTGGDKVGN